MESYLRLIKPLVVFLCLAVTHNAVAQSSATNLASVETTTVTLSQPTTSTSLQSAHKATTYGISNTDNTIEVNNTADIVARAQQSSGDIAAGLLIRATTEFFASNDIDNAQQTLKLLHQHTLSDTQLAQRQLLDARLLVHKRLYTQSVELLQNIDIDKINNYDRRQLSHSLSQTRSLLNNPTEELRRLLTIKTQLEIDETTQIQQRIINLLQKMSALEITIFKEENPIAKVEGWIEFVDIINNSTTNNRLTELRNWHTTFTDHPIQPILLEKYSGENIFYNYRQIALLLPITSDFGNAAKAFYDGLMAAHDESFLVNKPKIILYDIGEHPFFLQSYYEAAIADGADFIVGPLGKTNTEFLINTIQPQTDTLVIGDIPAEKASDNLYGISLSPENQAQYSAEQAFLAGYENALLLQSDDEWGQRVANAFQQKWQQLGGQIVKQAAYPNDINQSAQVIKKLLSLNASTRRYKTLEAQLDINLKFSARRNDDMDFIFLASNADNAHSAVSQLRFFQAHDLPIYSTTYVYGGYPNPNIDADLNGVLLGEIPWVMKNTAVYQDRKQQEKAPQTEEKHAEVNISAETETASAPADTPTNTTIAENTYSDSSLGRIYALGLQSYRLIPRLHLLRAHPQLRYVSEAMTNSVGAHGNIKNHPVWSQFKSGLITATPQQDSI